MQDHIERALSGLVGVAAVAIAVALVHQEFFPTKPTGLQRRSEYVANWKSLLPSATTIGNPGAPVTIIEFTDFECPFCRRFNRGLNALRQKYPGQIATAVVHFPLQGHQYAIDAARAVECSGKAGQFAASVDFVFENQDSLGKKPWTWFATGAGVTDTLHFNSCMADSTVPVKVEAGLKLGEAQDVKATPTILVNGWRYGGAPRDTELVRAIGDILAGKAPYKGFPVEALKATANR